MVLNIITTLQRQCPFHTIKIHTDDRFMQAFVLYIEFNYVLNLKWKKGKSKF